MNALLIAEKPSLKREIEGVYRKHAQEIGIQIDFMAQAGHLVGLKLPKEVDAERYGKWSMGAFPEEYPYEYKVLEGKSALVSGIASALKSGGYDAVIHAGDAGDEGELLVRLVLDYVGNRLPVLRFWTNDLTEGAILEALKNLKSDSEYDGVYGAALVRQHADYQFGMNITGVATMKMGDLCKLGRVKAPIISIISERELAIRNFVEKKTYKPAFNYRGLEFVASAAFESEADAAAVARGADSALVVSYSKEKKSKGAPKLFKLSTLQTAAFSELGFSASKTLSVLQSLYEAKAVTYPRTDCEYISSAVDVGKIARSVLREVPVPTELLTRGPAEVLADKSFANDKAIASEDHTAVVPTGAGLPAGASGEQAALYELVCRRFLAMFASPKTFVTVKAAAVPSGQELEYEYSEAYDVDPGYELVLAPGYEVRRPSGVELSEGEVLKPIEFCVKEVTSKPPARFNDGSIIKALDHPEVLKDSDGRKVDYKIGTPATRAGIIDECVSNGYFEKKKGTFYATEKALAVYGAFKDVPLFKVTESGAWEETFSAIRSGAISAEEAEADFLMRMRESVEMIKDAQVATKLSRPGSEPLGACPKCGSNVVRGKYGPFCVGKCGITLGKAFGKALSDAELSSLLAGKKTLVRGLTSKAGKKYDAYLTPTGLEEFSFTAKDGTRRSGLSVKYQMEFRDKKK